MLSVADLTSYVEAMRALGVAAFKSDGTEIVLDPRHVTAPPREEEARPAAGPRQRQYTDDQLLFANTEGLPLDEDDG